MHGARIRPKMSKSPNTRIATVEEQPYPHFLLENAMPENDPGLLKSTWPPRRMFATEIPGNYTWWINSTHVPPLIWHDFLPFCVRDLTRTVIASFAPWLLARFGENLTSVTNHLCLIEADSDFSGHPIHNHHWHLPNWIATAFVYLDSESDGFSVTTVKSLSGPTIPMCAPKSLRTRICGTIHWDSRPTGKSTMSRT